ncbi:Sec-independent protein translocase protein TatB [Pontixanthobacter aquaemixtae]|uniref:Sec-independent protein translocase protein TatB n=1 Tax=Pontixanthobacter aquaemixtae TaxID=1958940 RepID=A0A844ZP34_9SPHN|nr:Sec-independent protein translocase protein TatB [Pontixanthobacter aquaemixtae]MXO89508.1 twin-arginine translocase subunit TatB [Pontixanthobacter aquaemixtae]
MFDIGALELLLIVVVAVIVIGPKDMPAALRVAGRWVGKLRRASAQFRSGFDSLVREAELEEMEKKWKEQNAKIMAETPEGEMGPLPSADYGQAPAGDGQPDDLLADVQGASAADKATDEPTQTDEPTLPLEKPGKP